MSCRERNSFTLLRALVGVSSPHYSRLPLRSLVFHSDSGMLAMSIRYIPWPTFGAHFSVSLDALRFASLRRKYLTRSTLLSATNTSHDSFAYCIKVYLQNVWSDEKTETQSSAGLPSYTSSVRTRSARAVYRRVKKVVWLQWRGILIVIFILADVIFFSVVFIYMDSTSHRLLSETEEVMPWIMCLMMNPTNRDECYAFTKAHFVNQPTVVAVMILLSVSVVSLGSQNITLISITSLLAFKLCCF
jgi:hypothetical protein